MFERDGRLADHFPPPTTWKKRRRHVSFTAAPSRPTCRCWPRRAAISAAFPVPHRCATVLQYQEHGVDYIVALMNGYKDKPPEGFQLPAGGNYNEYFRLIRSPCRRR